jgi:ABC-2 type transport system permease protein
MKNAALLLRKDLLILRRSPALLAVLLAYPIVIALLIGFTAGYANSKPRVALVDQDNLPPKVVVAGESFDVDALIHEVAQNVRLIRMSSKDAQRQLSGGRVAAVITIPRGFLATLKSLVTSPRLILQTGTGGITSRVRQQMQALVFNLNRELQGSFIAADREYVNLLVHGGSGHVLGRTFHVIGLDGAAKIIERLPPTKDVRDLGEFVDDARQALALTDTAIRATASPIVLEEQTRGRTSALSAQVQAYGLALTITFLALLLAAGSLAAERDENVIGRLARGPSGRGRRPRFSRPGAGGYAGGAPSLVRLGELVGAKIALAASVALVLGAAIALTFGIVVEVGGVAGGEPWQRLPLVLVGIIVAGVSVGAIGTLIGALAREARAASLAGVLFVLPVVFVGLVPREVSPAAGWISDAFPFVHAVRFFGSALYDAAPWGTVLREIAWLLGLGLVFGAAARLAARRLAA